MSTLAFKTQLNFDPAPQSFLVDATGLALYSTPVTFREKLQDLSRLTYLDANFRGRLTLDASDTVECRIVLRTTIAEIAETSVIITAGTEGYFTVENVDLSAVAGQSALYVIADVIGAGASGRTAIINAQLNVLFPFMISGCG